MHKVNLVLESAQVDYRPTMINLTHVINIVTKELMGTINAVSRVREALGDNATSTKRPALPSGNASTTTTATAAAAAAGAGNPSAASGAPPESAGDAVGAAEGGVGRTKGLEKEGGARGRVGVRLLQQTRSLCHRCPRVYRYSLLVRNVILLSAVLASAFRDFFLLVATPGGSQPLRSVVLVYV